MRWKRGGGRLCEREKRPPAHQPVGVAVDARAPRALVRRQREVPRGDPAKAAEAEAARRGCAALQKRKSTLNAEPRVAPRGTRAPLLLDEVGADQVVQPAVGGPAVAQLERKPRPSHPRVLPEGPQVGRPDACRRPAKESTARARRRPPLGDDGVRGGSKRGQRARRSRRKARWRTVRAVNQEGGGCPR